MGKSNCEDCMNYVYDMETDEYYCDSMDAMDQDEAGMFMMGRYNSCPMYRPGNEYTIVRKQI
ncbi:MAG: hypothetical protein IKV30_05275 [Clostridia bacterium]|nr:hypothetical protein [Clostridia bacterium]